MMVDSAYAFKRAASAEKNEEQKIIIIDLPEYVIFELPSYLSLSDLPLSFVSKKWHAAAKRALPRFYEFQEEYQEGKTLLGKNLDQKSAFNILKKLRKARLLLNDFSVEEMVAIDKAFYFRNFESINETLNTHKSMRDAEFIIYPERLMQM